MQKENPQKYRFIAVYSLFVTFLIIRIYSLSSELDDKNAMYDVTTHCYHKNWKSLTYENFIYMLPFISERCAPWFDEMNIYRFGISEEWRYSMLPSAVPDEKQCYGFVFVGFSRGLTIELQIKRSLLFDCAMLGVDPEESEEAHNFVLNIGQVEPETLGAWNGMNERSLARIVSDNLELKQSQTAVLVEHLFVTEVEDVYQFLPYMLSENGFAKYLVPCQLTVDVPHDTRQIHILVNFVRHIIDEEHYTILSVRNVDSRTRIYVYHHSHKTCSTRYGKSSTIHLDPS